MKNRFTQSVTAIAALALFLPGLAETIAFTQQASAPPSQRSPQNGHEGRPRNDRDHENRGGMEGPTYNILPEGMPILWWRIPGLAQTIGLTADQQKKMDDILHQSWPQIQPQMHELHKQRDALQTMLDATSPDPAKLYPLFESVARARAALEVSNDKMLLSLRAVLTPDQWNKLQAENRRWRAQHPEVNQHGDRRDDHRNMQGKPAGNPSQPTRPPA